MSSLAEAIGLIIGAQFPFTGVSTVQSSGNLDHYRLQADPRSFAWTSTDLKTGEVRSFAPDTQELSEPDGRRRLSIDRIPSSFPEHVRLAFPMSLSIWGRPRDEYCPVSLFEDSGHPVLLLRHRHDSGIFGSLTYDPDSGRAIRLATPTIGLQLEHDAWTGRKEGDFGFVAGSSGDPDGGAGPGYRA